MTRLQRTEATLPGYWYYDAAHYARELDAIWYREWVCVGRQEQLGRPGDYFVVELGTQKLIITRDNAGTPRAYHNTCRHRGATLCTERSGHFRNGRIICPYHTWTYTLDGELVATPARLESDDFRMTNYPLYAVHVETWGGFLFVNLAERPETALGDALEDAAEFAGWPLDEMVTVHEVRTLLACNWKIFWENYSECYHCPRVHPELCRVVPLYREGTVARGDLPGWQPESSDDDGSAAVAPGFRTWTLDGQSALPTIAGSTATLRDRGMTFADLRGRMFIIGHPDYVRSVRLLPRGPEQVELTITWLLMPGVREAFPDAIEHMLELGRIVVEQDGRVCELNQQGLRSLRHQHGVLVPQEAALHEFHNWLRDRLGSAAEPPAWKSDGRSQ